MIVCDGAPDSKLALLDKWPITILHVFMVLLFLTLLWMIAVSGLHDMDEFVLSQLILAVGIFFSSLHINLDQRYFLEVICSIHKMECPKIMLP